VRAISGMAYIVWLTGRLMAGLFFSGVCLGSGRGHRRFFAFGDITYPTPQEISAFYNNDNNMDGSPMMIKVSYTVLIVILYIVIMLL